MRTLSLLTLAAGLALAGAASACDEHNVQAQAQGGDASAHKGCTGHMGAGATTASGLPACCAGKKGAATTTASADGEGAVLASTGHAGCPHAARTMANADGHGDTVMASTTAGEAGEKEGHGAGCPFAALRANAEHGCPMSQAMLKAAPEVRASGKVVCARCELHKSDSCASVFQAKGSDGFMRLCNEGVSTELLKLTKHGELEVNVHGRTMKDDAGNEVLCLEGFSIGTI